MKKLFIVIVLASSALFTKAQDTTHFELRVSAPQIQTIITGLSELKIKDALDTYMAVINQAQAQVAAMRQKQQESSLPKKEDKAAGKK